MNRNPFKIDGPAVVSFSGGRTSGLMLYRIIEAHGGTLPEDVKVIFNNTGKERPETLDFVERCSQEWGVEIVWLEYRYTGPVMPAVTGEGQWQERELTVWSSLNDLDGTEGHDEQEPIDVSEDDELSIACHCTD